MPLAVRLSKVLSLFGRRQRRCWFGATRAQLELRHLEPDELLALSAALQQEFDSFDGVEWYELNPYTRRVVVAFREGTCSAPALERAIERAEHAGCCAAACFRQDRVEHPSDEDALLALALEVGADALGLLLGAALKLTPVPASTVSGGLVSALTVTKSFSRLRRPIDERLGPARGDLVMSVLIAAGNAAAQRPLVSLVDVSHKAMLYREARSRRDVWVARQQELTAEPMGEWLLAPADQRPTRIPRGPIEEYADRAWMVALAGFGFSLLTTRSLYRATSALFGGIPKPARLGRDAFSADLGRNLASRQLLVLDPEALRRLDRIDCLVLAGDVVPRDRCIVRDCAVLAGLDESELKARMTRLLDAERLLEACADERFRLEPLGLASHDSDELSASAERLLQAGELVMQLFDGELRVAVAAVELVARTGLDELVAAAQKAGMPVIVSSRDPAVLSQVQSDGALGVGAELVAGIRRLQAEGRVVCTVASCASDALAVSDCGIGLVRTGVTVPWGAHILCKDDLSDVRFLIEASVVARQVAKQSVNIALAAATMGALVSAGGLVRLSTGRVVSVVNAATLVAMMNGVRASRALARQPVLPPRDRTPWHALDAHGVLRRLGTSELGLAEVEAQRRRRVPIRGKSATGELFDAITDELFNPLAPLLAVGAGLSAVAGSMGDAAMVGGVVVLNACVGGVQRFRTDRRIRDLSMIARRQANVHRDGRTRSVDAGDLVPGDIVVLTSGEVIPADCRILYAESLEVDTSSLTGESLPVPRSAGASFESSIVDRASMLYAGTSVAAGRATAVVVAVDDQTEVARGGMASRRGVQSSGVEQRLRSLIDLTAPVALGAGVSLVVAGLLRGRRIEHLIPAGVSLAVASVPEGLPVLATAAQLAAARRLSKRGALVRNARCIEALGRVDVLCFDKTGTVTEGKLALAGVSRGYALIASDALGGEEQRVVSSAVRAAPDLRYVMAHDDPTDAALHSLAQRLGVTDSTHAAGWERRGELPFEAGRGFHVVLGRTPSGERVDLKGAPEVVLGRSSSVWLDGCREPIDVVRREELGQFVDSLARRGLRVIAVAERPLADGERVELSDPRELTLLGFIAFRDPVRPTAAQALERIGRAGVRTVMITGDHPRTAESIANELGMLRGYRTMTGAELLALGDDELDLMIESISVFARVTPSQKARIVRALQRRGRVVAMVGDGANDAPAIRLANVGIAVGERSTSAARSAADVVLTDERIETLLEAIVEGRAMWSSIRDAVSILVGGNLGEIGFTLFGGLIDGSAPLNPRQLLLVNLLTDVAPAMAIALRAPDPRRLDELANEGPEESLGRALNREIAGRAVVTSLGAGVAWTAARFTGSAERARTVGLLALVGTQLGQTLLSGGLSRPVISTSVGSTVLLATIVQTPGLSQFFGCRPLDPIGWGIAMSSSIFATGVAAAFPQLTSLAVEHAGLLQRLVALASASGQARSGPEDRSSLVPSAGEALSELLPG